MKLILATRNRGKVAEIAALLADLPVEIITAGEIEGAPEVEEDALTLEGNALKKAHMLHEFSGLAALADDTGLEVDALDGRPGVYSARYAGPEANDAANRALLLVELSGQSNRSARFRTALAFIDPFGEYIFEGVCEGWIAEKERGEGGFGYDALFVPRGYEQTFAELDLQAKNAISHRGHALRAFSAYLHERFK